MGISVEEAPRVRSYIRRNGRITKGQRHAFEALWTEYGMEDHRPFDGAMAFSRAAPIILEIGFGNGEALLAQASKYPDFNFVGIEVYPPGIGHLLLLLETSDLHNIKIYRADAFDILEKCFADNSLAGINLFFPDPWPKKRHHKRRLVNPRFIALIAQKISKGGFLHAVTDWQDYAEQIIDVISQSDRFADASRNPRLMRRLAERPQTKFERRGIDQGNRVWNLIFDRV